MMTRAAVVCALAGMAVLLAACGEGPAAAPPDDDEVLAALRDYYRERESLGDIFEPRPPAEDGAEREEGDSEEDGAGAERDGEATGRGEACPEFAFSFRDSSGEERRTHIRIPCEAMDQAEAEVSQAMEAVAEAMSRLSAATRREIRARFVSDVADAEILACVPAGDKPGFVCDVETSLRLGETREELRFVTARFVEGTDGWRAFELKEHR